MIKIIFDKSKIDYENLILVIVDPSCSSCREKKMCNLDFLVGCALCSKSEVTLLFLDVKVHFWSRATAVRR